MCREQVQVFSMRQVVKLARKYDPEGVRTLGVVTKCDDAAVAEASDIVEKASCLCTLGTQNFHPKTMQMESFFLVCVRVCLYAKPTYNHMPMPAYIHCHTVEMQIHFDSIPECLILRLTSVCSFAFRAQVLMKRVSDVRLELGFHCVVNRSQKNIDEAMTWEELRAKEEKVFTENERMKDIPEKNWGILRLMEKVAKIQEARVDEFRDRIKDAVSKKTRELTDELRRLESLPDTHTETGRYRVFNDIVSKVREDLAIRVTADYVSAEACDRELTIAPKVHSMVSEFKESLRKQSPDWLGAEMMREIEQKLHYFKRGYTVNNFTGPEIFIYRIRQTFIVEGLLENRVSRLIEDVGDHLQKVVKHVIQVHSNIHTELRKVLHCRAQEFIDERKVKAEELCQQLANIQEVTFTTYDEYEKRIHGFRTAITHKGHQEREKLLEEALGASLPEAFLSSVKTAENQPRKHEVLEIVASLHIYSALMLQGFVEMSAKAIFSTMLQKLANKLDTLFREPEGDGKRPEQLVGQDHNDARRRDELKEQIPVLTEFKVHFRR
eukprot:Skav221308  [mRNA]  locus=scaffold2901:400:2052:+ [translate_table: standard]